MSKWKGTCHRCGKKTSLHTLSRFNTQLICVECATKERKHASYKRAVEAETRAVRRGDYDFPGIGKPVDL
jgi:hypothetical protein